MIAYLALCRADDPVGEQRGHLRIRVAVVHPIDSSDEQARRRGIDGAARSWPVDRVDESSRPSRGSPRSAPSIGTRSSRNTALGKCGCVDQLEVRAVPRYSQRAPTPRGQSFGLARRWRAGRSSRLARSSGRDLQGSPDCAGRTVSVRCSWDRLTMLLFQTGKVKCR